MHEDSAEKKKARRDLRILLVCTVVGVVLPLVIFCLVHLQKG
jgi:hypothetical protein